MERTGSESPCSPARGLWLTDERGGALDNDCQNSCNCSGRQGHWVEEARCWWLWWRRWWWCLWWRGGLGKHQEQQQQQQQGKGG
jgi:hypothetical protein